ncbi:mevalonate kinase [Candidatus Microgenomates bacterium]|nr:mevalonate kinase [Candidatus Microgenomates bacterium]
MTLTVSAPGKIHLLGEHAVVYGRPALLAAVDKRIYVSINSPAGGQVASSKNKEELVINSPEKDNLAREAISVFKKAFSIGILSPLEISITSGIPIGSGLGSSAALSAALIGALMKFVKNLWNPIKINELVYEVEKTAHGNPSGADNTAVVFGGLVWYRKEFDFFKSIWNLPISAYKIPKFLLIDTGRPSETTREMVEIVASQYDKNPKTMEAVFSDQENQTKKMLLALKSGDRQALIEAMKKGQRNLDKISVVGSLAGKIIKEIEKTGGAAKVSGAGGIKTGSGMILCYHQDPTQIQKVAEMFQLLALPVELGEEGVRIE